MQIFFDQDWGSVILLLTPKTHQIPKLLFLNFVTGMGYVQSFRRQKRSCVH